MEIEDIYSRFKQCSSVSTDTRKLEEDCMYFALKGDNFDGNKFVKKAFEEGAKYCIVDDKNAVINDNCIIVDDVLLALQELATFHRNSIDIPIISLTGSNGKTTTKELIKAVLSTTYKVKATLGNLNNHIGVPLTLLSFSSNLDFGIVEMGANHLTEINFLCGIAQPDFGLITNFGKAHLEGFGGTEGVIKGKSELYDFLKANDKVAFINTDDPKQVKQIGDYPHRITFGSNTSNDYNIQFIQANPFVELKYENSTIKSQLIGDYNYGNIAVAVVVGLHFNVTSQNIQKAIETYKPDNNRSEILEKDTTKIILDAYNANPTSMMAAVKNFKQLEGEKKFLFLGDMFELGVDAEKEHQSLVSFIEEQFDKNIYIIGKNFYKTSTKSSTHKLASFDDLKSEIHKLDFTNATILIKGSRGMALERILELL
ncbi:UDP-N-acetylmuramoyl-tripeptide--D-alanyl-D-alanine ligase [Winogradskyella epiphytica]|uniref:UDP-N-acetylmuramoyl-tripeptide--D-alanyl-D-alanine ligase n=1 Tax=Winogradskyella epiphytica TaxID=262005 RepID=A0A2V4WUY3_9FLAO|nr:UDP-N-acetylmuramoyl-tripeptide--D-alanyl-D-alanine ligase [Winogradskyella epiphytica]PYE80546.1 UDP-N-acetylmuramoyl-tripeptide--D-alanyl-D-alanine ligase [Winogradskyella epiphytica]GGW68698.1 UDP-N-acetylmuramoyl-tripeptide--D-alanyl-D-alanine ligase [Winogradskyella epiphytica]